MIGYISDYCVVDWGYHHQWVWMNGNTTFFEKNKNITALWRFRLSNVRCLNSFQHLHQQQFLTGKQTLPLNCAKRSPAGHDFPVKRGDDWDDLPSSPHTPTDVEGGILVGLLNGHLYEAPKYTATDGWILLPHSCVFLESALIFLKDGNERNNSKTHVNSVNVP